MNEYHTTQRKKKKTRWRWKEEKKIIKIADHEP